MPDGSDHLEEVKFYEHHNDDGLRSADSQVAVRTNWKGVTKLSRHSLGI